MRRHDPPAGARKASRLRLASSLALALLCLSGPLAAEPPRAELEAFLERVARRHEQHGAADALATARARGLRTWPGGLVSVILEPRSGRAASIDRGELARLGATVASSSRSRLRVRVPVRALRRLTRHPDVSVVRAPLPTLELSGGLGGSVSEAVALTGAAGLQQLGIDGAGIRVAVVDLGFTGLSAAIGAGELPAGTITLDYTGTGVETGTSHGTVVAEHVLDMAPGVELHCLKVADLVDLENAADYARTQGIDIVNHSVGWAIASYYDDTGAVSDLVNQSRDVDGVFWAIASGNNARRHWRGGWVDADGDDNLDFAPGDDSLRLSQVSTNVCLYLNWNQYGGASTNLDLFVTDRYGLTAASSQSPQTGWQAPVEQVCFPYSSAGAPYDVRIEHRAGPTDNLDVTLFSFYNEVEYPIASAALMDPAPAHGAFTVGAVNQWDWGNPWPPIQLYSSQGPTTDGRLKPDLVGPDGTTSSTYGVQGGWGTSFSAATAAGAAALLLQNDPTLTPDALALDLAVLAGDVGPAGPDAIYGNGALSVAVENVFPDDADNDGVVDVLDNCPFESNPGQSDVGGVASLVADGIGDACQCADVTGDGVVLLDDLDAIQQQLIGVPLAPGAAPLCNAIGAADEGVSDCTILDVAVIRRALAAYLPGIGQVCSPAMP